VHHVVFQTSASATSGACNGEHSMTERLRALTISRHLNFEPTVKCQFPSISSRESDELPLRSAA